MVSCWPSVCPFVCLLYVCQYFWFRMCIWVTARDFHQTWYVHWYCKYLVWDYIWAKFVNLLHSCLPATCPCFRFRTITWLNISWLSLKLLCALILSRFSFGLGISSIFDKELSARDTSDFHFRMIIWVNFNGFSPNLVCTLLLLRPGSGLLSGKYLVFIVIAFHFI